MVTITDTDSVCNIATVALKGTAILGYELDTLAAEEAWASGKKETISRWTDGYRITVTQEIAETPLTTEGVDVANPWNFGVCFN